MQSVVGIIIGCVAVDGRNGPAIEFVEAPVVGRCLRVVAVKVPFVHQTGAIASGRDDGGDGGVLWQQVGTAHNGGVALRIDFQARQSSCVALVVAYAGVAAITPRHQRATRRRANATAGVCLCETGASASQTVDVRRLYVAVAVAGQVAVAHIIGQDEDDVRVFRRGLRHFTISLCLLCQQGASGDEDFFHFG